MNDREIVCADLNAALEVWRGDGFRIDSIYPADDPHTAHLTRAGERVLLTSAPDASRPTGDLPPFRPGFILSRSDASKGEGRAGMKYRDLIPGRLGGRYVASLISIPEGGPVADWVHFHRIALQLIYVRSGWVKVVYEDQGEPFVMHAGDLVLQPPQIRHRVLESSAGLQVVELGSPALHETIADHELPLPTAVNTLREYGGQRFVRHVAAQTDWTEFHGGQAQETKIHEGTRGLAEVRTIRGSHIHFPAHDGELVFGFVLDGSAQLHFEGEHHVDADDAFVVPPGASWEISNASEDFRLLHVTTAKLD